MKLFHRLVFSTVGFAFSLSPIAAQWLDYPTPGVPRTPDGKPNLSAPTPRTAAGKPDFVGAVENGAQGSDRGRNERHRAWATSLLAGSSAISVRGSPEVCPTNLGRRSWSNHELLGKETQTIPSATAFPSGRCGCIRMRRSGR